MEQLFYDWGYAFLIVSALIEGEVLLLIAGSLAYHGFFQLHIVMLFAFVGALIHDQLLYWVGRFSGPWLLQRFPKYQPKAERAFLLLNRYNTLLILGFRFVYGLRTMTPIIIGMARVPQLRYFLLTVIAAGVWAVVISYLGYTFAEMVSYINEKFEHGQRIIAIGLVCIATVSYGAYWLSKKIRIRRRSRRSKLETTHPSKGVQKENNLSNKN